MAVTSAVAPSTLAPRCRNTLMTERLARVWLSMCSMSLTVVVRARSKVEATRPSISRGGRPA
jgi:hypothetical protein